MPGGHHHRAGAMRQTNKRNKRSKSSKRSMTRAAGGKVNASAKTAKTVMAQSKADRKNRQQQLRDAKRQALMRKRRGLDDGANAKANTPAASAVDGLPLPPLPPSPPPPPRVVGIISLGPSRDIEEKTREFILSGADRVVRHDAKQPSDNSSPPSSPVVTCKFDVHKKDGQLTLLTCAGFCNNNKDCAADDDAVVFAALDMARVCDVLLLVIDGNSEQENPITEIHLGGGNSDHDNRSAATGKSNATTSSNAFEHLICGDRVLAALKAQGLPTPVTVLAKTDRDPLEDGFNEQDYMTIQSTKSLRRSSHKRRLELKKYVSRFAATEFGTGHDRVVEVDLTCMNVDNKTNDDDDHMDDGVGEKFGSETAGHNTEEAVTSRGNSRKNASASLVRTLCSMSCSAPKWVSGSPRSYLIADSVEYSESSAELELTGYVRGMAPFDASSLIHVPNLGTFACKSIRRAVPPLLPKHRQQKMMTKAATTILSDDANNSMNVQADSTADAASQQHGDVIKADPDRQDSLEMFATPDALEGEQNLIGFDEDDEELDSSGNSKNKEEEESAEKLSRPAGWSDYQSAWIDAVDDDLPEDAADRGELAEELNRKTSSRGDAATVGGSVAMDLDDANDVKAEDKRALLEQRRKQQKEHQEFPDEVEVDEDAKASDRFARYRSLKSFRKSVWDPKENLPDTYASVFHFTSFKATQRSVMNEKKDAIKIAEQLRGRFWGCSPNFDDEGDDSMEQDSRDEDEDLLAGCVPSGSYIKLTLQDVAPERMRSIASTAGVRTAVSLLPHENKVSVLHMGLCQSSSCEDTNELPVKSKDVLTFRCGWRTWQARPVFSQHNLNCDKHKFERFMPVGGTFFAASIFGPVTYTPCPVLVFRGSSGCEETTTINESVHHRQQLVATGSMIGADADRIVVKRIVLTGYPVRVHKRHATVKYMFYNPDDVKWFKPAGLYTKHGLQGNIEESVGEHGTMKCLFNAPIKQHDTVCLPLYKRIYPKYASENDKERKLVIR